MNEINLKFVFIEIGSPFERGLSGGMFGNLYSLSNIHVQILHDCTSFIFYNVHD